MRDISIDEKMDKIHDRRSKEYFKEVLSCYANENYRSAVVMLWSVAVCDTVYKLQSLIETYSDPSAEAILRELTTIQESNPKSAEWELRLIDDVHKRTNLLDPSEYENLRHLQQQRHLSAHPVLNANRDLHQPDRLTVRALINCTLDGLLTKPPLYTQKILEEFLRDLEDAAPTLTTEEKLKKFLEARYLTRMPKNVELSIFKKLWKLVFRTDNDDCNRNRNINSRTISLITTRHKHDIIDAINSERDYYSNIAATGLPTSYLVFYLCQFHEIYLLFNDDAKIKINHCIETEQLGKTLGWFIKPSLEQHYEDVLQWIVGPEHPNFEEWQWTHLAKIQDTPQWEEMFAKLLVAYFGASRSFDQADQRFALVIEPYLSKFNKTIIPILLQKIEDNGQVYARGRSYTDNRIIKKRIDELYPSGFDLAPYPMFSRSIAD
ncbi:MAG TPA: hypothetical protein DER40_18055 [Geobacter sp.]|nr:hypothetical protein [Geobacter sp.]